MPTPDKNASDHPLPGSVSNQNAEEAEPGHDDQTAAQRPDSPRRRGEDDDDAGSGGEAGEGSQSTGNPASAG